MRPLYGCVILKEEARELEFAAGLRHFISSGKALAAAGLVQKEDGHGGAGLFAARVRHQRLS